MLLFFLGVFGAQRFYLGEWVTGLLWLATVGLLLTGWIICFVHAARTTRRSAPVNMNAARGPLHVVVNPGAGAADGDTLCRRIRAACADAARSLDLLVVQSGQDIEARAAEAVRRATADAGVVVAAGGDGTLSAVAQAVLDSGRPFGVLPQGTFNYFGRAHGIPTVIDESLRILLDERPRPVQVGEVDGRVFLVNAGGSCLAWPCAVRSVSSVPPIRSTASSSRGFA